jgi:uncharacterized damage-inducible protein DinB
MPTDSPPLDQQLCKAFLDEVRRRLVEESVGRLRKCIAMLSEEEIWFRPNEHTVSIGNLVLHLCGNLRQWVLAGLAHQPDNRVRRLEFEERGPLPTTDLMEQLDAVIRDVDHFLSSVTPAMLVQCHRVQGFEESGMAILIHVTEHFSYHVGQITYAVKSRKNVDTRYYDGVDLNKTS